MSCCYSDVIISYISLEYEMISSSNAIQDSAIQNLSPSQPHFCNFWHALYLFIFNLAAMSCLHFPQDWEATNSKDSILISPIPNKLQVQRLVHNRCSAHVCWIDFFKSSQTTYFHSCFQKQLALCFVFPSRRLTSKELKLRTVTLPNTMAGAEIIVNKLRISSTHLSLISYILERWCY